MPGHNVLMLKTILCLLLLIPSAWAQDLSRDIDFIETQNTLVNPFNIPVYVNLNGEISLVSKDATSTFNANTLGQVYYKRDVSLFSKPIKADALSFEENRRNDGWIEIKRVRWEGGAGLGGDLADTLTFGLVPFKGARQVMIRHKESADEKTPRPKLPEKLEEVRSWRLGDQGTFQRLGGIQVFAAVGVSVVNILNVTATIQNLFNISLLRAKNNKVILSIAEEKVKSRKLTTGQAIAKAAISWFKGKRLSTQFILDLDDRSHHELYQKALKGEIIDLQKNLPSDAQKTEWKGSERMAYYGIPAVIGKHHQKSRYEMDFDGEEEVLDVKTSKNSGFLLPLRNHNRLVYQTDETLTLYWYSEMNKADKKLLEKHFLKPGRDMGLKGFGSSLPEDAKLGAATAQLGLSFTREEIERVDAPLLEEILGHLKNRCEELALKCAKPRIFKKIKKKLRKFMTQKWEELRDNLGFLMIDEPALIHSYIKAIKAKKKVYFKFLNQKYQSMEGAALIEI